MAASTRQAGIREAHRLYRPSGRRGRKYTDEQVMLTLAMLAYRGFHDLRPGRLSLRRLHTAVESGLEELEPVKGQWDLVWGPVTYQSTLSLFDDAAMYVVRSRSVPDRYVVAIRGTNPVSAFDWLFGDFWAGATTPWRYGDPTRHPDAALSLSTSLGLNMLRALRSPAADLGLLGRGLASLDEEIGTSVRAAVRRILNPIGRGATLMTKHLRRELRREMKTIAAQSARRLPRDAGKRVERLIELRQLLAPLRSRIGHRLAMIDDVLGPDAQLDALRVMEGTAGIRNRIVRGLDLEGFLTAAVARAEGPVEIFVTGHSKGGALCIAVAAWLADTQGMQWAAPHEQWDPDGVATVSCYSFAGPTPGNAAFAARVEEALGPNLARTSNTMDVVPHAWAVDPSRGGSLVIGAVPVLYGAGVHHVDALDLLAQHVTDDVADLEYAHVGGDVNEFEHPIDPDKTLYFEQAGYQHAAAYLEALDLTKSFDVADLFTPLA